MLHIACEMYAKDEMLLLLEAAPELANAITDPKDPDGPKGIRCPDRSPLIVGACFKRLRCSRALFC